MLPKKNRDVATHEDMSTRVTVGQCAEQKVPAALPSETKTALMPFSSVYPPGSSTATRPAMRRLGFPPAPVGSLPSRPATAPTGCGSTAVKQGTPFDLRAEG